MLAHSDRAAFVKYAGLNCRPNPSPVYRGNMEMHMTHVLDGCFAISQEEIDTVTFHPTRSSCLRKSLPNLQ
jgi:hypothetical protein